MSQTYKTHAQLYHRKTVKRNLPNAVMSFPEIAEKLNMPQHQVRIICKLALQKIKPILEDYKDEI
jgi:hypothetical protein